MIFSICLVLERTRWEQMCKQELRVICIMDAIINVRVQRRQRRAIIQYVLELKRTICLSYARLQEVDK